jgi:hypothetical protein
MVDRGTARQHAVTNDGSMHLGAFQHTCVVIRIRWFITSVSILIVIQARSVKPFQEQELLSV